MLPIRQLVPNHHGRFRYFDIPDSGVGIPITYNPPAPYRSRLVAFCFTANIPVPGPDDRTYLRLTFQGLHPFIFPASSIGTPGLVADAHLFIADNEDSALVVPSLIVTRLPSRLFLHSDDEIYVTEDGSIMQVFDNIHVVLEQWIEI